MIFLFIESRISSVKFLGFVFSTLDLISSTPVSFAISLILDLNSLEKFLILPHHLPKVLSTAGKSFGPTKMMIHAAMTRYSTPPIPGNITIT